MARSFLVQCILRFQCQRAQQEVSRWPPRHQCLTATIKVVYVCGHTMHVLLSHCKIILPKHFVAVYVATEIF